MLFCDVNFRWPWEGQKPMVKKSEYDTVYGWYEEYRDELARIRQQLSGFASAFSTSTEEPVQDSTVQLAVNAHDQLLIDRAIMSQQKSEIESLQEQIDALQQQIKMATAAPKTPRKSTTEKRIQTRKPRDLSTKS